MLCEKGCVLGYLLELENKAMMMMMMIGGTWNVCIRDFTVVVGFLPQLYCENQGVY